MKFTDIEIPYDEAENYLKTSMKQKINDFFYEGSEYNKLLKETTYYLIGEKGSGKTAYSVYFCNNTVNNIKSRRYPITVDDYNKLIQMKKDKKLSYTHYTTLWKAIILVKLFASIDKKEVSFWGIKSFDKINKLLEAYHFSGISLDAFSPVSYMDSEHFVSSIEGGVDLPVSNVGSKLSSAQDHKTSMKKEVYFDSWTRLINDITNDISSLRLNNHHYLFIDGIDSRPSDIKYSEYKECVYPLVRAVYELNSDIFSQMRDRNKGRLQVVLLSRMDIFLHAGLSNPGSKINDNAAFLDWGFFRESEINVSSIYELTNNILKKCNKDVGSTGWNDFFDSISFSSILHMTTAKPRDIVRFLRILQDQCKRSNCDTPTKKIIDSDSVKRAFSIYMVDSIRTALSFYYDEDAIDCFINFLKSFRKIEFRFEDLDKALHSSIYYKKLGFVFGDTSKILGLLFDFNMICFVEKGPYYRWKYREVSITNYNYALPQEALQPESLFRFHPSLEKELGLYLR